MNDLFFTPKAPVLIARLAQNKRVIRPPIDHLDHSTSVISTCAFGVNKINRDEGGWLNPGGRGRGILTGRAAPQNHGPPRPWEYHANPPPRTAGIPRPPPPSPPNLCPTLNGGGGSWYSRGRREHPPVGIPRPRPPRLAAPGRLC